MIQRQTFDTVVERLGQQGRDDIEWAESLTRPCSPTVFALEAIFVICNAGMQHKVARGIFARVRKAVIDGKSARTVFKHAGKAAAIDLIWQSRERYWNEMTVADDLVAFCARLPRIGRITKYHLAKNFGADVAKPDVHLERLAAVHATTPQNLCADLARSTGYRIATIDTLLWRACATGVLDSRTGEMRA